MYKSSGLFKKQAKNVIILGGSRIAYYLAQMLSEIGIAVKIIDKDEKSCEILGNMLPKAVVIRGDGTRQELLLREGISHADAFVSLTGLDETIRQAFFHVSSVITTTGYSLTDYNLWPGFSKMLLMVLMFVGGCASSTAGGIFCTGKAFAFLRHAPRQA